MHGVHYLFFEPTEDLYSFPPDGLEKSEQLALFKLMPTSTGFEPPALINTLRLKRGIMKAITSVKLSSTNRFALIGYGVRSQGIVEGHEHPLAACEIMAMQRIQVPSCGDCNKKSWSPITTVAVINDVEDEVNAAYFHPVAGQGLVYGTKRGKVRAYHSVSTSC